MHVSKIDRFHDTLSKFVSKYFKTKALFKTYGYLGAAVVQSLDDMAPSGVGLFVLAYSWCQHA